MTKETAKRIVKGITDKIECNTVDIDDWAEFWGFTRDEYEEFLDIAIEAVEPKWIPVSERLPEEGQIVLFCDIDDDIMVGYHVKGRPDTHFTQDGTFEDMKNVKAWMPLPEPYKAENKTKQGLAYADQDTLIPAT